MEKKTKIWIIFVIGIIVLAFAWIFIYPYLSPTTKPYDFAPNNSYDYCKLENWVNCGLKVEQSLTLVNLSNGTIVKKWEMCYKLANNTNSRWENCQIVTLEQKSCFEANVSSCFLNWSKEVANETNKTENSG